MTAAEGGAKTRLGEIAVLLVMSQRAICLQVHLLTMSVHVEKDKREGQTLGTINMMQELYVKLLFFFI